MSTFGESHGAALGCIIDGCPPNLPLSAQMLQRDLNRRRPGTSRHVTQRQEKDIAEILSGVFGGRTTGSPIGILIRNTDAKSSDYEKIKDAFRPGHADFTTMQKYGIRDYRGGGRASARETAMRVAAGAVAKQVLAQWDVRVRGRLAEMGGVPIPFKSWKHADNNAFFAADSSLVGQLEDLIKSLRRQGDSCGAVVEVVAENMPTGWGEPVFDRLDADIAKALMSINAVKGVEIGAGFAAARQIGSTHGDEMTAHGFANNQAGGVLGGISSGQDIVARLAIKPTSSIRIARRTITTDGRETTIATTGRHDPCVGIRAVPIAEAMLALVLADHALRHRGQCGGVAANPFASAKPKAGKRGVKQTFAKPSKPSKAAKPSKKTARKTQVRKSAKKPAAKKS